jgi:hypothetical protein
MENPNLSLQTSTCQFLVFAHQQTDALIVSAHPGSPATYLQLAIQILFEYDIELPEPDRLDHIVQSALAAQNLYYTASIGHPSTTSLYRVFQSFVLDCVTPTDEMETL